MAVVLGRLMLLPADDESQRGAEPYAKIKLQEIDDALECVLEVAQRLDKRLAKDLRALGIEPDPDDFDHELVNEETAELAHCRNQMEEVFDMLTMIKDISLAENGRSEGILN